MARLTGKDLAFTLGGTSIGAARNWELTDEMVSADATVAGDAVNSVEKLRTNWNVRFSGLLTVATPYVIPSISGASSLVGTSMAFVAKVVTADTNGLATGTGLLNSINIRAAHEDMVEISGEVIANGAALTYDLSPAT